MSRNSKGFVQVLVVVLLLVLVGGAAYYFGVQKGNLSLNVVPTSAPVESSQLSQVSPTLKPTTDPIANWKDYTNAIDKFSFKYPQTWTINTKDDQGDERKENIQVSLTKDQSKIQIYANMVGIGGVGQDFQGTAVQVDGHTLYKYKIDNTYNNTKQIGITDSLKQSLGLFQISGKTYSVTLTYPNSLDQSQASSLESEFNQILSTFKFTQ